MDFRESLKVALCNNDLDFMELNKGNYSIDERFPDESNDTLLLYSISDPQSKVYEYLLSNNANIGLLNDEGESIIHGIVYSGDNSRLCEILNSYNVNIDHQSKDGATPLLLAISLEKKEIAHSLILAGADVNIPDFKGIAPLHLASQLPEIELVKLLLEKGADPLAKTENGNIPLALAANSGLEEVAKLLFCFTYH